MSSLTRFRKKLSIEIAENATPEIDMDVVEILEETADAELDVEPIIVIDEAQSEEQVSIEEHMINIDGMMKQELDDYALYYGIEIDRRQSRANMVTEFITKLKEKN